MTRFYVDMAGVYIGGFAGVEPPDGAVEVQEPPPDAGFVWSGSGYVKPQAVIDAEQTAAAKQRLREIDDASIRSIREWLAAQPDAPQFVKNYEAAAIADRAKVKP